MGYSIRQRVCFYYRVRKSWLENGRESLTDYMLQCYEIIFLSLHHLALYPLHATGRKVSLLVKNLT